MTPTGKPPVLGCPPSDLDKVDMIRKIGLQDLISLPQIAVVGDQSSGKSTLLEYISGITFPKDAGMCTRFATEVSMRPAAEFSAKVSINGQPDSRLREPKSAEEVAGVILQAKMLFVEESGEKPIYHDRLTVELYGPGLPILTLVDLPGYIHTHSIASTVEEIENLVEGYLHSPRTVIMAVIPANRDFETNVVIQHVRRFDPEGQRTLCVLTKPDQVDSGTERLALDILAGKMMPIARGYHIVKNKNFEECKAGDSREKTAWKEALFFSRSPWSSISPTEKGVISLVQRLSETLGAHVAKEFLGMRKEILKKRRELVQQLDSLGPVVGTDLEKSNLLQKNINRIMQQIKFLVDGHYSAGNFSSRKYYIRARVQEIHCLTTASVNSLNVARIMKESQGRELRGMVQFEPFVILSRKVIKKWAEPTTKHITEICQVVEKISCQVITKECEKILVDYFLERMAEYINHQQKQILSDASELFDDEMTPQTCQEFEFPREVSSTVRWAPEALLSVSQDPEPACVPVEAASPTLCDLGSGARANPVCSGRDPGNRPTAQSSRPEGDRCVGRESEAATESDSSEASPGATAGATDSAGDARIRWFVRAYCTAAATRYVDAICLYAVERLLFKKCDLRVHDWFMDDKSALARVREPAHTSALRLSLPVKIEELTQALAILDK